ncbi:glycoside hydrolase superfamily [Hyaloscypha finlandica]|nr:glycoside hydrolase superfamily [Hyaloscypha finlandica]KAH8756985.1 glycoside hydrolase superfamily [Hyaloscypha sp. PMI_1271]
MRKIRSLTTLGAVVILLAVGFILAERYFLDLASIHQKVISLGVNNHDQARKWWKEAVIYEIYPASFKDSDGDGIGDIPGIISKLDYLHDLGVDVIHICSHYQSPQVDMGYDISDYEDVHRPYGTVEDVQALINATHTRGMKIIFDLVINHSSNQHKWFEESRSSKDNPKRDWYFWRPARWDAEGNRRPPNNWRSHFAAPAWTWDEKTEEYYLHIYAPEMPDFNWENEETREGIYNSSMIFWLERGIDGFRINIVNKYSKDIEFPDAPIVEPWEETQPASEFYNNGPRIHEYLGEMKNILDRYGALSVGELSHFPFTEEAMLQFASAGSGHLSMVSNYELLALGQTREKGQHSRSPFNALVFKKEMSRWQTFASDTDAWVTLFLENHDAPRSISRFGSDGSAEEEMRSGKMIAILLATMTGTLFLYQGQELGLANAPRSWSAEEFKDVRSVNMVRKAKEKCKHDSACLKKEIDEIWETARDHARLPMQWDSGPNAGFTNEGVTPWMRVNDDWKTKNVELQSGNSLSLLGFWKRMLRLRKEYKDLFVYGVYQSYATEAAELFVFTKVGSGKKSLTVVNMSGEEKRWEGASSILGEGCRILIENIGGGAQREEVLSAWEGRVYFTVL